MCNSFTDDRLVKSIKIFILSMLSKWLNVNRLKLNYFKYNGIVLGLTHNSDIKLELVNQ